MSANVPLLRAEEDIFDAIRELGYEPFQGEAPIEERGAGGPDLAEIVLDAVDVILKVAGAIDLGRRVVTAVRKRAPRAKGQVRVIWVQTERPSCSRSASKTIAHHQRRSSVSFMCPT